ncbi:NEL-type E3 ubiquitin ligase domain-containing protein [Pseudomonas hormoni]|nr:NEL-type E3 ubiquitin ligase domain-containing protein [Pseudomonas hormoni]
MLYSALPAATTVDKGKHYDLIKTRISDCFQTASPERGKALAGVKLKIEQWYADDTLLKAANKEAWAAQNQVDRRLNNVQDVYSFAAPLLQARLKERYGVEDDVKTTYLRLYLPKEQSWWVINTSGGVTTRTVSLLDAALHNFAAGETSETESEFISKPGERGHFTIKPIKRKMTIQQFQALCRELDIGAKYTAHVKSVLLPSGVLARKELQDTIITSQKTAIKAAALMARMKGDISENAHRVVTGMLAGQQRLTLEGKVMQCCDLAMMDTTLTGIVVMTPVREQSRGVDRIIAYVPHDPEHPLKEYPSAGDFVLELTRQLRDNKVSASSQMSYRQFFSQFVDQRQRGHFFAGLEQRLSRVTWHQKAPLDQRPSWRETPVDRPELQFSAIPFTLTLSESLYQRKLDKILNDARDLAVSTADADSKARRAWWENVQKMLADIFNAALLVITPFVPVLGEAMLVYSVYQLSSEVIEGVVDLAEGLGVEAAEHVIGVVTDLIQLAAVGAGFAIAKPFAIKLSPFVERMKPVQLPDGEPRLWHPDLTPYEQQKTDLPSQTKPDATGLHSHEGKQILRVENKHYEVRKDTKTGQHHLQHPKRSNAYQPQLTLNGAGAYVLEGEQPRTWNDATLLRRIGPSATGLSDSQLETARRISGTDPAELRGMYVKNQRPPVLLTDTIKRLGIDQDVQTFIEQTNSDDASREQAPTSLVHEKFPDIPAQGISKLLAKATRVERETMTHEKRIPLRLKTIARELQLETRTARGYEGFYRDSLISVDTERLTLNALRLFSDSLGDLRIEIRADSVDGELRCMAGPADASVVRILVKGKNNTYEVRDSSNAKLHEAADLYRSILQALPEQKRRELGYQTREGGLFKQWVMVKTEPVTERRTLLDDRGPAPPPSTENLLLVRGPALSRWGVTLEERVADLYPHFSENEMRTFIESLYTRDDAIQILDRLEKDIDDLHVLLRQWQYHQLDGWSGTAFTRNNGQHIIERLVECFERKSTVFGKRSAHLDEGYALDLSTEFSQYDLDLWWNKLPELGKYLDQVSTLNLDSTRFSTDAGGLLKDFRHVRQLSARQCGLTAVPESIGNMHLLETLRLSDNDIRLAPADVERLRNLTRLEIVRLDNNPLGASINIDRMPRLRVLSLNNTGIDTWPSGIFSKRRPRSFFLDMQQNPITHIPDVAAGSDQAFIIARTRLYTSNLTDWNRIAYEDYRKSVGIYPQIFYSRVANRELIKWPIPDDMIWGSDTRGIGTLRPELWSDLALEPNSEGFFMVIEKLRMSADYRRAGESRQQLADRVWRMIDAAYLDTAVREELFTMATAPTTCADAGAQLFNNMGIKVLTSEAYSDSTTAAQLQGKLVKLAKGAARLEQVNAIARADITARTGMPDEVEVHLAYETGLALRLDLPWQSQNMLSRRVAGVSDAAIAQAYDTVIALEQGDGLVNGMLDQSFWSKYLRETWPGEFRNNAITYENKADLLDQLRQAQQAWADAKALSDPDKVRLKERLKTLAGEFPVPESVVFTGDAMTDQTYERLYSDIGDDEQELGRRLTREALKKAGV